MATKSQAQTATLDPQQDRLLRLADVRFISGLGKTSIYAAVRAKTFPQPVRLTEYAVAWRKSEVDAWLAGRPTARDERELQIPVSSTRAAAAREAVRGSRPVASKTPTSRPASTRQKTPPQPSLRAKQAGA